MLIPKDGFGTCESGKRKNDDLADVTVEFVRSELRQKMEKEQKKLCHQDKNATEIEVISKHGNLFEKKNW